MTKWPFAWKLLEVSLFKCLLSQLLWKLKTKRLETTSILLNSNYRGRDFTNYLYQKDLRSHTSSYCPWQFPNFQHVLSCTWKRHFIPLGMKLSSVAHQIDKKVKGQGHFQIHNFSFVKDGIDKVYCWCSSTLVLV